MKLKPFLIVFLLLFGSLLVYGVGTSSATNVPIGSTYVPITLQNSQSSPTVSNLAVRLSVDWANYAGYLNSNVSNVRFYTNARYLSTPYELYAWMENGNSPTSTSSTVWVNLSNNVMPASSSLTIYMAFLPKSFGFGTHWGEAPELSGALSNSYWGIYDNGANVFPFYYDYKGNYTGTTGVDTSTLNFLSTSTSTSSNITQNNGLIFHQQGANNVVGEGLYFIKSYTVPLVYQNDWVNIVNSPFGGTYMWYSGEKTTSGGSVDGSYVAYYSAGGGITGGTNGNSYTGLGSISSSGTQAQVSSSGGTQVILWNATSHEYLYSSGDQNQAFTDSTNVHSSYYFFFEDGMGSGGSSTSDIYWSRGFYAPPNGVMPTASFGSTSSFYYHIDFHSIGSIGPGPEVEVHVYNTGFSEWVNSSTTYNKFILGNGSYDYKIFLNSSYTPVPESGIGAISYDPSPASGNFTVSGADFNITVKWSSKTFYNQTLNLVPQFYVPITIFNNYNYYTPVNFTQRISMDWAAFSEYLNTNISNVRIYDSLAFIPTNELYGWVGTNDSSSSTSSLIFINMLDDLVPAQGHTTIYLVFMQKNTTWGIHWGLNPTLSNTYGKFDNGRMVFSSYFNALEPLSSFTGTVSRGNISYDGHTIEVLNSSGNFEYNNGYLISQDFTSGSFIYYKSGYPVMGVVSGSIDGFVESNSAIIENTTTNNYNSTTTTAPTSNTYSYAQFTYYSNTVIAGYSSIPYSGTFASMFAPSGEQFSPTSQKYLGIPSSSLAPPVSFEYLTSTTPNNVMPTPTFGSVAIPIYPVSFTSYGLPSDTKWTVAIGFGSGNNVEQLSSTSQTIFSYLPNGTYTFTIGSITNGSYQSGFDDNLTPSPSGGQLIVTGSHTNQVVIWNKAELLLYNLIPGTAYLSKGRIILPIFVVNYNNIPANNTTISQIWSHLKLTYVSVNNSDNAQIPFAFSSSGYGEFSIFVNLTVYQILNITHTNATVSMVSPFNKTSGYTDLAVGSLGPSAFADSNITSVLNPPKQNHGFVLTPRDRTIIGGSLGMAAVLIILVVYFKKERGGGGI